MRESSNVRRNLVATATICLLLWVVTGVSVLAVAYHEHHHHADTHDHDDVFNLALHGHAHDCPPDHDHQLKAPLSASRTMWSSHSHAIASQVDGLFDTQVGTVNASVGSPSETRDFNPPAYLMNCVLLT